MKGYSHPRGALLVSDSHLLLSLPFPHLNSSVMTDRVWRVTTYEFGVRHNSVKGLQLSMHDVHVVYADADNGPAVWMLHCKHADGIDNCDFESCVSQTALKESRSLVELLRLKPNHGRGRDIKITATINTTTRTDADGSPMRAYLRAATIAVFTRSEFTDEAVTRVLNRLKILAVSTVHSQARDKP